MSGDEALELARAAHERVSRLESALEHARTDELQVVKDSARRAGAHRTMRELGLHPNTLHAMLRS